ncbi:hypothetical protein ACQV2E_24540, partial [Pantoea allii]
FYALFMLALVAFAPTLALAADNTATPAQEQDAPPKLNATVELPKMQKILDKIKSQVSVDAGENKLTQLNEMALELSG